MAIGSNKNDKAETQAHDKMTNDKLDNEKNNFVNK